MKLFTIGCDPEFFLRQRKSGKMICAIPFIKGTKHMPENLPSEAGNIQHDNVAVEFATNPAETVEDFINKIQQILKDVSDKIPKDCELMAEPSAHFDSDQLKHPDSQAFGCDPDYDAWALLENEAPFLTDKSFRSCGAHIHVGHQKGDGNKFLLDFKGKMRTVRTMDAVHGVISTALDNSDSAIARKTLYGKAGAHRIKDYGVEYRVLSNFWLKSPELVMLVYNLTHDVLRMIREDVDEKLIEAIGKYEIQNIINKGLVDDARKAIELYISPSLSNESVNLLKMCTEKIDKYDFVNEWGKDFKGASNYAYSNN